MRFLFLFILFISIHLSLHAGNSKLPVSMTDSTIKKVDSTKYVQSNQFYDKLIPSKNKTSLSSMLLKSIFVGSNWRNPNCDNVQLVEENDYFKQFEGKKIRNITILCSNIVNTGDSTENPIEKWHVLTKQYIIERNLFFKKSQKVKAEEMVRNQQYLRSLRYISDAYILIEPCEGEEVNVLIFTRDNLSLAPGLNSLGSQNLYLFASESNMLGTGNRFELGVIANPKTPLYRGFKTEYGFQNIAASFFDLNLYAYKNLNDQVYRARLNKSFLAPTDFAGGILVNRQTYNEHQILSDTVVKIEENRFDLWAGKSFELSPSIGSFFINGLWSDLKFPVRFGVTPTYNLNYQNKESLMFSLGFYRESFYRGNLIYGFGKNEDIPYGYKVKFVGGRTREEFGSRWYMGAKMQIASMTHFGYTNGKIELGTYLNRNTNQYEQTALSIENYYFTKLIPAGSWGIRSFFVGKYTRGMNRLQGERELLFFNSSYSPRVFQNDLSNGTNRLILSTETVGFSPYYLYNFRFAFYGFADWGWLGNNSNIFKNDDFTSVGLGVRIKNERLIFQTVQIRIGWAIKNPSNASVNWLNVSEEARMKSERLIPSESMEIDYR
ncbi:MAG: hypothetical protein PHV20_09520 [Bacteroidales bacterium]|nr:hypothetical protein [Bacteroidales bacterium]